MNKKSTTLLLVLSLIGLILSGILLSHHYRFKSGDTEKSLCTINATVDCDVVNTSVYSEIFSIPMSGLGFLFYLTVAGQTLTALLSQTGRRGGLVFTFLLSAIALLITLIMAYLSWFKIGAICLLCSGMYAVNLLIFILSPGAAGFSWKEVPSMLGKYINALFGKEEELGFSPVFGKNLLLTILVFVVGSVVLVQKSKDVQAQVVQKESLKKQAIGDKKEPSMDELIANHFQQTAKDIHVEGLPVWGNPNAKVKIVEFSDFECPFCRRAAESLKPSFSDMQNDLAFYFVNYPLDNSCNPYMQRPMHEHACDAAAGGICAHEKGKFWEYHDVAFKNQPKFKEEELAGYAKSIGLDPVWFKQCMGAVTTTEKIKKDLALGKEMEIQGTPSVFVNGRKLNGWGNRIVLRQILKEEIKRTQ
jgi:protein-disulfide isomerase/uncharacterized membrane protein